MQQVLYTPEVVKWKVDYKRKQLKDYLIFARILIFYCILKINYVVHIMCLFQTSHLVDFKILLSQRREDFYDSINKEKKIFGKAYQIWLTLTTNQLDIYVVFTFILCEVPFDILRTKEEYCVIMLISTYGTTKCTREYTYTLINAKGIWLYFNYPKVIHAYYKYQDFNGIYKSIHVLHIIIVGRDMYYYYKLMAFDLI